MNLKIGATLALASAAAITAAAVATPAFASGPGDHTIDAGEVVVWQNANFSGPAWDFKSTVTAYPTSTSSTDATLPQFITNLAGGAHSYLPINDNTSSIANYDTAHSVIAWTDANGAGSSLELLKYQSTTGGKSWSYSSLGLYDDQFSSHYLVP